MQVIATGELFTISDLHIVGQGDDDFVCEDELVSLIREIQRAPGASLLILGDLFDLWQTDAPAGEAIKRAIGAFPSLFAALADLAAAREVLYLPGNHDRACTYDKDARKLLAAHGIRIVDQESLLIRIGDSGSVLAEHGHASDPYNRYAHAPNPAERPLGEHLMRRFINPLKAVGADPAESWLWQIDNVQPLAAVPWWLLSKYFYREAGWWIKALAVPSALLFGLTKLGLALLCLRYLGADLAAWGVPDLPRPALWLLVGFLGIDAFALGLLAIGWVIRRDVLKTLRRWQIGDIEAVLNERRARAEQRAFERLADSKAQVYLFGHTHEEFARSLPGGRAWVNTGTWVLRMQRVRTWLRLPPVFVSFFHLTYARITADAGKGIRIELRARSKRHDPGLTFLERLALIGCQRPRPLAAKDSALETLTVAKGGPAA